MKLFARTHTQCTHVSDHVAEPRTRHCEECSRTFNLRICTECGHVGCCESQRGHNTAHARESSHPVIKSFLDPAGEQPDIVARDLREAAEQIIAREAA